jgi:hypothetical protein
MPIDRPGIPRLVPVSPPPPPFAPQGQRLSAALGLSHKHARAVERSLIAEDIDLAPDGSAGPKPKPAAKNSVQRGEAYREGHRERYRRHYGRRSGRRPGRCRKNSVVGHVRFRPLTFEQRTWLMKLARFVDRRTRRPRQHGGDIKRTGLAVMASLLFDHHNEETGQCDPSVATLVESDNADGISERAAYDAIDRLEALGFLIRIRRAVWEIDEIGRRFLRQDSNAYIFDTKAIWKRWRADCKRCGETPKESLYNIALRRNDVASASSADLRSPAATAVASPHSPPIPEKPD